jgi:hypothetical protein
MGVIDWLLRCGDGGAFVGGLIAYAVFAAGFRFRLVVDAEGSRLVRTWFGLPWSRRSFGPRPRVVVEVGWDFDDLIIVPEHPRDADDRFVVVESSLCGWTMKDLDASADVANREIARVAAPRDPAPLTHYRSPPAEPS